MIDVLLIEDDPTLRSNMARGIAKMGTVSVIDVGTLTSALAALDARPPAMIISDIDLPDRSGLELLGELGRRGLKIPVLFVSAYLKAYGAQIPPHALVDVLEKPVSIDDVRAAVLKRVPESSEGSRSQSAAPPPFGVADYVQLASMGSHSVRIDVSRNGAPIGWVSVIAGQVWSARDEQGEGPGAFKRMAFGEGTRVQCRTLAGEAGPRTIDGHWEGLLLDAARERDERDAGRGGDPFANETGALHPAPTPLFGDDEIAFAMTAPAAPTVRESADHATVTAAPDPAEQFDAAWDEGVQALLVRDYPSAAAAFIKAEKLNPNHAGVAVNLARLREMGIIGTG